MSLLLSCHMASFKTRNKAIPGTS